MLLSLLVGCFVDPPEIDHDADQAMRLVRLAMSHAVELPIALLPLSVLALAIDQEPVWLDSLLAFDQKANVARVYLLPRLLALLEVVLPFLCHVVPDRRRVQHPERIRHQNFKDVLLDDPPHKR